MALVPMEPMTASIPLFPNHGARPTYAHETAGVCPLCAQFLSMILSSTVVKAVIGKVLASHHPALIAVVDSSAREHSAMEASNSRAL